MIDFIKSLIYIEAGSESLLINVKWSLVAVYALVSWYLVRRTLKSFRK